MRLVAEGIRAILQGFEVLRGVSLHVLPGETVALVGRNGAGKTTTLRCLMGLVPVKEGRIALGEVVLNNLPPHRRAALGIGYAPEDRRLVGHLTVEENLLLPTWALGFPAEEARRRLEEVYSLLPELVRLRTRSAAATLWRGRQNGGPRPSSDGGYPSGSSGRAFPGIGPCAGPALCGEPGSSSNRKVRSRFSHNRVEPEAPSGRGREVLSD
jgi:hypothetical protein